MTPLRILLPLLAIASGSLAPAQVLQPEKPKDFLYEATLRYRIRATGPQRIVPFEAMAKHLKEIGFKHTDAKRFDLDLLDPGAEFTAGIIAPAALAKLFDDANIKTVLIQPAGGKLLDDPKKAVQIRIEIPGGLNPAEQQKLHKQVIAHLGKLGFEANSGYDHDKYTRIRGTILAAGVPQLLKDLRALPLGWFLGGGDREEQPSPLTNFIPIRVVEVLPDLPAVIVTAPPVELGKITIDLANFLSDPVNAEKPLVVEAILESDSSDNIRRALGAKLLGISIEGVVGSVVTLRLPTASRMKSVVELPEIRHVRLPRIASETVRASKEKVSSNFVGDSNLYQLHNLGYDGEGITVAVIGSEFPELKSAVVTGPDGKTTTEWRIGKTLLPVGSKLLDLTAEVRPALDPAPANPLRGNAGSASALAVHTAAPKAKLLLVRIDPSRFHQLLSVAKAIAGAETSTPALLTRGDELSIRKSRIESQRKIVTAQVEKAFSDLSDDERQKNRRDEASAALKQLKAEELVVQQLSERYLRLTESLAALPATGVVVNTLVWETGYPLDAQSELSRYLEAKFAVRASTKALNASRKPAAPGWVQAASEAVGSVWSGAALDADANGKYEFGLSEFGVSRPLWTNELNFLNYRALEGTPIPTPKLPAGSKVRFTLQWREPRNRALETLGEATHEFKLRLFQQLDPNGKTYRSDELVEVARSLGAPTRLMQSNGSGVFEITLETTLATDGSFAVSLEGGASANLLPTTAKVRTELRPHLIVELVDPTQAAKGSLGFDFRTRNSGVGLPGDSNASLTVAPANIKDPKKPESLSGAGPGIALVMKPDLLVPGTIVAEGFAVQGTGISAGYSGGAAASLLGAGVRPTDLVKSIGLNPGDALVLPTVWLNLLKPKRWVVKDR